MKVELTFWGSGERSRHAEFWRGFRWRIGGRPWHYITVVRDIGQSWL